MNYKSDLIYPSITKKDKNVELAKNILNIYTGRNSIINNILLYLYQSSFLDENTKNIFFKLIDVELIHAKIISKLISSLGFYPRYIYKNLENYKYFNTSYINYESNKIKIIENNIKNKEEMIMNYTELINNIDDKNIKDILKRLIIDYELHIKIFKELLTT